MVHVRPPHPDLADCIAWYWAVDATAEAPVDLRVDAYVDARADLVFNFGAPYRRTRLGEAPEEVSASNFDAQRTAPIAIEQRGAVVVVGVRFQAGGVAPFTDVVLAEATVASAASAAAACGVSARHAARLFRRHLGLPPRTYRSIVRFQGALDAMAAAPEGNLGLIAATCGYADQAHLVRDVRRFAGGPPTTFRGYFPPLAPRAFAPNVVRFVQDGEDPSA